MNVIIDHDFEQYMHNHHHDILTLKLVTSGYSIGVSTSVEPKINYRKPRHEELYDKYIVDDITVYVAKNIKSFDGTIRFEDKKILGMHRCNIRGVKLEVNSIWLNRFPHM